MKLVYLVPFLLYVSDFLATVNLEALGVGQEDTEFVSVEVFGPAPPNQPYAEAADEATAAGIVVFHPKLASLLFQPGTIHDMVVHELRFPLCFSYTPVSWPAC